MRNNPPTVRVAGILSEGRCPSNVEECDEIIRLHVVVHIHHRAEVICLRIFKDEESPMAMIEVRHDDSVLTLQTAEHPPVLHVPEPLP
jgi:hypothetical protein